MTDATKNTLKTLQKRPNRRFSDSLLRWNQQENTRQMPWKGEKDPYKIWLSEIILQQTRVEQGMSYYNRFIQTYPSVSDLANAKDEAVFKLWEGLGYYSRCRNLLVTARYIAFELGGVFPQTYEALLKLKGVGPYTAAAIASFAFRLPHAVLDGNVFRVISRYFGIEEPSDTTTGKALFASLAADLLDTSEPGTYNQAIMDFGATVCKPALPFCASCPLHKSCEALRTGRVNTLPLKSKTILRKNRWFYYFVFQHNETIGIRQRTEKDIWQGLHEFYLVESGKAIHWSENSVTTWLQAQLSIRHAAIEAISTPQKQQLTHRQINGQFIRVRLKTIPESLKGLDWVHSSQMRKRAFPRFITAYLEQGT
ncbi:MAG TPA: A/G-specific adenine glycosylase [Sediminibacterium sp.]|nr:A/G-specific adenine glycosylase [Sediminibacterium sp.]